MQLWPLAGLAVPTRVRWASLSTVVNTNLPGSNMRISIMYGFCTFPSILAELHHLLVPRQSKFPPMSLWIFSEAVASGPLPATSTLIPACPVGGSGPRQHWQLEHMATLGL